MDHVAQPKIVLKTPLKDPAKLKLFVEACVQRRVELIAVVGDGCEDVHDAIDDVLIGDGSVEPRFIPTTWHSDESIEEVIEFAQFYGESGADAVQLIEF